MELRQRDDHNDEEEYHSLCLADALPLSTGAAIEGIVDVQGQHFTGVGRFASGQSNVLVEQLKAVGQGVGKFGYASAMSFFIFILVAILSAISMKVGDNRD